MDGGTPKKATAPLDILSQFLKAVRSKKYETALKLSNEILAYEPKNELVLQYQPVLKEMIEELAKEPSSDEDEDDDDDDEDEDEDEDDDEDDD